MNSLLLALSLAWAFPDADPERETVVVGGVELPLATARGDWIPHDGGLVLAEPTYVGDNYWLSEVHTLLDGMVRARFTVNERLDFSLLLRMTAHPEHPEEISGVGLTVKDDEMFFQHWDRGVSLAMQEEVAYPDLKVGQTVEVVVYAMGPQLAGFLYDADTLEEIASVTVREPTYRRGVVGVRGPTKRDGAPIAWLSVMSADAPIELEPRAEEGPFGPQRLIRIRPEDGKTLPEALRPMIKAKEEDSWVLVAEDPSGLEKLRRADVVPISVSGHVPWLYLDPLYQEWHDDPPTKTKTGFRIDQSFKDADMVEALLKGWAERYPERTKLEALAETRQGRTVWGLKISDNADEDEDEPAMLITGATHGAELLSTEYALDVIQTLLESDDPEVADWVKGSEIWCVPLVNPDGNWMYTRMTRWAGRKNGADTNANGIWDPWDGVDLNRNYPFRWGTLGERGSRSWNLHYQYRGQEAASEPEVQGMMALAERERFVAAISFHTLATLVLSPYTIDGLDNPEPDVAWQVAEFMVAEAPKQPNGKTYRVRQKIYAVDGTDQDWFFHEHGTLAYIVEGSHHNPEEPWLRTASIEGIRPVWRSFFARILEGPRVSGRVVDSAGRPVEARIEVVGLETREDEVWTSRPRDGRFDRVVPGDGTWVVVASADGREARARVKVGKRRKPVEIVLP